MSTWVLIILNVSTKIMFNIIIIFRWYTDTDKCYNSTVMLHSCNKFAYHHLLIPGGVTGFLSDISPSDHSMALGSTQPPVKISTRNIPGGKGGRCMRLTSPPSHAVYHEIWEPKPPGTLWATPGLLWDSFTFTLPPFNTLGIPMTVKYSAWHSAPFHPRILCPISLDLLCADIRKAVFYDSQGISGHQFPISMCSECKSD